MLNPGLHSPIDIRLASPLDIGLVSRLYAQAGYGAAVKPEDTVMVAMAGATLAGVVRLCPEEGITVLRGMQVDEAWQGRGIGRRLLAACAPRIAVCEAYCLPYAHLEDFYADSGFARVAPGALPGFLAQRLTAYLAGGRNIIAMHRRPSRAPRPGDSQATAERKR